MDLMKLALAQKDYVAALRRYFHEYPELSGLEENTLARIKTELDSLGIPWEEAPQGGVIGRLEGSRPGKTVLLRADVDALPVQESPENGGTAPRTCCSKVPGVMHACGHDAHAAMLLGAARLLSGLREQLAGTLYFTFERGEEAGGNAVPLLEYMQRRGIKPDTCWAIHVYSSMESGTMSVEPGGIMAGNLGFNVTIRGRGGHGSRPDQASSPIDCFNGVYTALNAVRMRYVSPFEPLTMSLGTVQSGTRANIIPGELTFTGTVRCFDREQAGLPFKNAFRRVVEHICAAYDCEAVINRLSGPTLGVVNDPDCAAAAKRALSAAIGSHRVVRHEPWMASESFGLYQKALAPGVFAFLGVRSPETGGAAHHNEQFDLDENALPYGVAATAAYALEMTESDLDLSGRTWQGDILDLVDQIGSYGQWTSLLREQRSK